MFVVLSNPHDATITTLASARAAGAATLNIGNFINALVKFLIIAWVLFAVVKAINMMKRQAAANPSPPVPSPPTKEEVLLTEIRDVLVRGAAREQP